MLQRLFLKKLNPFQKIIPNLIPYSQYRFSNFNKEEATQEIYTVLKKIPFENGKNLVDLKYVVDLQIKEDGSVSMLLKLDQNYRKIKTLCQTELNTVPWIKNVTINMAPKVEKKIYKNKKNSNFLKTD